MWCTACAGHDGLERLATRVVLCLWCREEIAGLRVTPTAKRPGLYKYEGTIRALIIRAKVQGDGAAVRTLLHLFRTNVAARDALVVPCPSSLWSRLRGRLDLAALMAHEVGQTVSAPWDLYWRMRKRTRAAARSFDDPLPRPGRLRGPWLRRVGARVHGRSVLLVDDVTTTGHTLRAMRNALAAAEPAEIRAITLAQARFD